MKLTKTSTFHVAKTAYYYITKVARDALHVGGLLCAEKYIRAEERPQGQKSPIMR